MLIKFDSGKRSLEKNAIMDSYKESDGDSADDSENLNKA
jgi:hypothetical protein